MNSILKVILIFAFGLLPTGCQRPSSTDEEIEASTEWEMGIKIQLYDEPVNAYERTEWLLENYGHTEYVSEHLGEILDLQGIWQRAIRVNWMLMVKEGETTEEERVNWYEKNLSRLHASTRRRVAFFKAAIESGKVHPSELDDNLLSEIDSHENFEQQIQDAEDLLTEWKQSLAKQQAANRKAQERLDDVLQGFEREEAEETRQEEAKKESALARDKLYRPWIFEKDPMRKMELLGLKPRFVAESHEARKKLIAAYREEKEYAKYATSNNGNTIATTILLLEVDWSKGEMNVRDRVMTREKMVSIFASDGHDRKLSVLIEGLNQLLVRRFPDKFPDIKRTDKIWSGGVSWFRDEPIETTIEILDRYLENDRIPKPAVSEPQEPENSAPPFEDAPSLSLTEKEISLVLKLPLGTFLDALKVVKDEETRTVILEEKVKSLTLSEAEMLQRDLHLSKTESRTMDLHIERLKKEQIELARKKLESEFKQPMVFDTKEGGFSVTGIYMASTFKHVRLKRVDNEEDVTVERSLLSDKTNALVKEKEELKRKLESSPDAKK